MSPAKAPLRGEGLTERQREVYELRHSTEPPMIYSAIGERLGISVQVVSRHLKRAEVKVGSGEAPARRSVPSRPDRKVALKRGGAKKQPEAAADAVIKSANPLYDNLAQIARDVDMPISTVKDLIKRYENQWTPVKSMLEDVQSKDLEMLWGTTAKTILDCISIEDIKKASLRDKGIMAAIATDKLLLLRGQPTEIIHTVTERQNMRDLVAEFIKEVEKRGEIIDVNPATGNVQLVPAEVAPT